MQRVITRKEKTPILVDGVLTDSSMSCHEQTEYIRWFHLQQM